MFLPHKTVSAYTLPCMPPDGYDKGGRYPAGTVRELYYRSPNTNSDRKMVVYTPPGYTTAKKYPVIYAVHGIDNWPASMFADWCVQSNIIADNLIGEGKIEPVIIVAYDNNNVNSHNEIFNGVIPYVESHYSVQADADHRGIYGYSMGGGVAFAEGIGYLDTFHHVCPTSALPMNHPSDEQMFPNGGAEAKKKLKTLMLSCGTIDWCGFYPSNLATHNYCVKNNIPHAWLSVEGGNHDGGVWSPAMWNFLQLAFPADGQAQPIQPEPSKEIVTVPGETQVLPDGWYNIKSVSADKYLSVKNASATAGANVEISAKTDSSAQKWYLKNTTDGYITLTSGLGEFMIDIDRGLDEDDANVQIYHGYGGTAQQFMVKTTNTKDAYVIATRASNLTKAVDVQEAKTEDGSNVLQFTYNGHGNQQWMFEPVEEVKPSIEPEPSKEPVTTEDPEPSVVPSTEPTVSEEPEPEPSPSEPEASAKLKASTSINKWDGGYVVNFKLSNQSASDIKGWSIKIKKSEIEIYSSWNVTVKEDGEYYVLSPVAWNDAIEKDGSIEFGIQGTGSVGSEITCIVE